MAVNPAIIACPADTWVKVATNVLVGTIYRRTAIPGVYLQTIRVTGDPAPTDDTDAVLLFNSSGCGESAISSDSAVDVYVKAVRNAGEVRVDL